MSAFWDLYHFQESALFYPCAEQLVVRSLNGDSGLLLALGFTAGPHRDLRTSVWISAFTTQCWLLVAVWTDGFARSIPPQSAQRPGAPLLVRLLLGADQQHRYLYTRGCKLSNMWLFYEFTDLAAHMPRDPLVKYFSTSFSLAPTLFVCNVFSPPSGRLPWWHLTLPSLVQWAVHPGFLSNHLTQYCLRRWHWHHQR